MEKKKTVKNPIKVGDRFESNRFGWATVTAYNGKRDVDVLFDSGLVGNAQADALRKGLFTPAVYAKAETKEAWVAKAVARHGDKYDYTDSVFRGGNTKIEVYCKECLDVFTIDTCQHIGKESRGCPMCKERESKNKYVEEYIDKASIIHSAKYMYDIESLKATGDRIRVLCPLHGWFDVSRKWHMRGGVCLECKAKEENEKKAMSVVKDGYSLLSLTDDNQVWLLHDKCGRSFKTPLSRYTSDVRFLCSDCGVQNITFDVFKERAAKIFGDEYEYSDFVSISDPVTLLHKACGNTFTMEASTHTHGNYGKGVGCAYCAKHGFSVGRDAFLYVLSAPNGYVKAGVTHQTEGGRLRQINRTTRKLGWEFSEKYSVPTSGVIAKRVEIQTHKHLSEQYEHPEEWFDGRLETYKGVPVEEVIDLVEKFLQDELSKN